MKVTKEEKKVIEKYLNYYYENHSNQSFKNQMALLYDHLTHIVK